MVGIALLGAAALTHGGPALAAPVAPSGVPSTEPAPTCTLSYDAGPPARVLNTVQDSNGGLVEILVTRSENADTVVPPFIVGTTDPVVVTSTKIDQTQPGAIEVRVTDAGGLVTLCTYDFVNDPPVATDDAVTIVEGASIGDFLPGAGTDPEGDPVSWAVAPGGDPEHGTLELDPTTGAYTYEPDMGFSGTDTFDYTVSDPQGASDSATVTITVTPGPTDVGFPTDGNEPTDGGEAPRGEGTDAAVGAGGELPATGRDVTAPLIGGVALVAAGVAAVGHARRLRLSAGPGDHLRR
jgi:hypothetical protein